MNYNLSFFSFVFFILISCSLGDSENGQESELAFLKKQQNTIEQFVLSVPCTDNASCKYIAFGSKPCGGPWTYLAYNTNIDEEQLLNIVATYNANEERYNTKWDVTSDCEMVLPPSSVECIAGVCTVFYD